MLNSSDLSCRTDGAVTHSLRAVHWSAARRSFSPSRVAVDDATGTPTQPASDSLASHPVTNNTDTTLCSFGGIVVPVFLQMRGIQLEAHSGKMTFVLSCASLQ